MPSFTAPDWLMPTVNVISFVILIYFSALQLVLFGLLILSFFDMRRRLAQNFYADYEAVAKSHFTFPISVLVPSHNEESNVVEAVRSVLSLDYPQHVHTVLKDGSTDEPLDRLRAQFKLPLRDTVYRKSLPNEGAIRGISRSPTHPNLLVIDKSHAGKSAALNAGINLSHYPLLCTIDADSLFQENALLRVVRPFLEDPDRVIAVGGQVRVANGCRVERGRVVEPRLPQNILAAFQVVEYLRAFVASQRGRWHRGLIHSLWLHRSLGWGRHSGSLRFIGLPYYVLFEVMGPLVELLGYILIPIAFFMGFLSPVYFWAFLFLAITSGAFLSISAVFLEEVSFGLYRSWGDFALMIGVGVLENFSYRLLTLLFRLGAVLDIILGRGGWGKQERAGFDSIGSSPAQA